ncbi:MAG: DUF501 domain-containing protein [Actinomycetota bacterium]
MQDADREIVTVQIGRAPRGETNVAGRCVHGLPAVVRTAALLDDGEPFPTLYWLTCPAAARAIGRLEGDGFMRELNDRLASDETFAADYRRAHEDYVADRDKTAVLADAPGAGGMPDRVKCLHALYAHEAATGLNPVGAIVRDRIEPLECPGPCVHFGSDGKASATPGHPHLRP